MGVHGSCGGGERRGWAASHHTRLGHLLLELGDGVLQLLPCLALPVKLLLQFLPVALCLLQPLPQLRQLEGGGRGQVRVKTVGGLTVLHLTLLNGLNQKEIQSGFLKGFDLLIQILSDFNNNTSNLSRLKYYKHNKCSNHEQGQKAVHR